MSAEPSQLVQRSLDGGDDFREKIIDLIPFLRAFARTLSGHRNEGDDLCQETLVRAWQARANFEPGTNIKAWLFMILRNQFYSEKRRSWRRQPWDEDLAERTLVTRGAQESAAELSDVARAMRTLPNEQREALILIGAGEFTYEEAAKVCGCAVGTVKSRVARGRRALEAALSGQSLFTERRAVTSGEQDIMRELDRLTPPEASSGVTTPDEPSRPRARAVRVAVSRKS